MENISTYSDFMNEGLFSRKITLVDKITKIAKEVDPIAIKAKHGIHDSLEFTHRKVLNSSPEIDPYGEDFGDVRSVDIKVSKDSWDGYYLYINNKKSSEEGEKVEKIYNILYKKYIPLRTEELLRTLNIDNIYEGLLGIFNNIDPPQIKEDHHREYSLSVNNLTIKLKFHSGFFAEYVNITIDNIPMVLSGKKLHKLFNIIEKKFIYYNKHKDDRDIEKLTDFL